MDSRKRFGPYTGCEGLFKLWQEAMVLYQSAVVKSGVRYERFCEDFINSRLYPDARDSYSRNEHNVNVRRIHSLLVNRKDLVRRFSAGELSRSCFDSCMNEFMLVPDDAPARIARDFECNLNARAVLMITKAANEIPLFKKRVTEEEMAALFNECQSHEGSLVAINNGVLSYFFSQLNYYSIISSRYPSVIECHRLIMSSSSRRHLTAHLISASLRQWEDKEKPVKLKIDRWLPLIKEATFASE